MIRDTKFISILSCLRCLPLVMSAKKCNAEPKKTWYKLQNRDIGTATHMENDITPSSINFR